MEKFKLLDRGYTSDVYLISSNRVCKSFLPACINTNYHSELEAYERFSAHDLPCSILKYYGKNKDDIAGIDLELAENGNLYHYLWQEKPPSPEMLYQWALQAAEGLEFAHSCGVMHSDIYVSNFLLDDRLNLKVADFAGASIDGGKSWSSYRLTHRLFDSEGKDIPRQGITATTEIFAFGSAMYHMVTGHDLFPELDYTRNRAEIERRLQEKSFPEVHDLSVLGSVIGKCWNLEYETMTDVMKGIKAEKNSKMSERL